MTSKKYFENNVCKLVEEYESNNLSLNGWSVCKLSIIMLSISSKYKE